MLTRPLQKPLVVLLLLFLSAFGANAADTFTFTSNRRTGGGNFNKLNAIVNALTLPLDLDIPDKTIIFPVVDSAITINIPLVASIGDTGVCVDLKVNPGGDLFITGVFLPGTFNVPGFSQPMKQYEITVRLEMLQFQCTIPLKVEVDGFLQFVNTVDGFGDLTFRSVQGIIQQKVKTFSPNFALSPPVFAEPGACDADPVELTYTGDELGEVVGISITSLVIEELEKDPNHVFNDVRTELCKLGNDLATEIAQLIVDNPLVNRTSDFFVDNPFVPNAENKITALNSEELLRQTFERPESLLDLTDRDDFFVGLIIPDDPNDESIVNTVLDLLVESDLDLDPLLLFLNQTFPSINLQDDGTVKDLDVMAIIDGSFFDENGVGNGNNFSFPLNLELTDFPGLAVDILIDLNFLKIDIVPPPDTRILKSFQALGPQTLLEEGIDMNDIVIRSSIDLSINIHNPGGFDNLFLEVPFDLLLDETFTVDIDWKGFVATFGILLDIDLLTLQDTEIGGVLNFLFECVMNFFPLTPRVTGGSIQQERLDIDISQFFDAILVAVADVVEVIIPVYQIVLPTALDLIVSTTLTDQEIIEPQVCPLTDKLLDDIINFPYDFTTGIIKDISDAVDAETVNDLLVDVDLGEGSGLFLIGDEEGNGEGLGFAVPVPVGFGYAQEVAFEITSVSLEGILPPFLNELVVFKVLENSTFFPQELENILDLGSKDRPIIITMVFKVAIGEVVEDEFFLGNTVGDAPPPLFPVGEDVLDVQFRFDRFAIFLDFFLRYSEYDVDSLHLIDLANIGCYVSHLNFPGGVTKFDFILETLRINAKCEPCNNVRVQELFEKFDDLDTAPAIQDFFDDIINRFGLLIKKLFDSNGYEKTLFTAQAICDTGDYGLMFDIDSYEQEEYHTSFLDIVPYMAFFGLAVLIPSVVAFVLARHGPRYNKLETKKLNNMHNSELLQSVREMKKLQDQQESDEKFLDHLHLTKPMMTNPKIPLGVRIAVPIILAVNLVLFIIGDTGDAVRINLVGEIMSLAYAQKDFLSLSVITSVIELWKSGGYLLAGLLFAFSVAWPYIKLFLLVVSWFTPPWLIGVHKRGKLITWLDILGRFSFAEFHFLVVVLVVFRIKAATPQEEFLPEEPIFEIELDIEPLISLFTFAIAVVVSILLSNLFLVYQHSIEAETRMKLRGKHLKEIEDKITSKQLRARADVSDDTELKLTNWNFTHTSVKEDGNEVKYMYSVTKLSNCLITSLVLFTLIVLVAAAVIGSLKIEIFGFFSFLIEFANGEREYQLSVLEMLAIAFEKYGDTYTIYFVGLIFVATITLIPLAQAGTLFILMFKRMNVAEAHKWAEAHHVMSVWCCVDVFVLAMTLTVLELPTVAAGLAGTLSFCQTLGWLMATILEPMELVEHEDSQSGCFALHASVSGGAFIAVFAVLVLYLTNYFVSKLFHSYLSDREKIVENQNTDSGEESDLDHVTGWHKFLAKMKLIELKPYKARFRLRGKNKKKKNLDQMVVPIPNNATAASRRPGRPDGASIAASSRRGAATRVQRSAAPQTPQGSVAPKSSVAPGRPPKPATVVAASAAGESSAPSRPPKPQSVVIPGKPQRPQTVMTSSQRKLSAVPTPTKAPRNASYIKDFLEGDSKEETEKQVDPRLKNDGMSI